MIISSAGTTLTNTDNWMVRTPGNRPGLLQLQTILPLTDLDQGIYTCIIPDNNNNTFGFNVGLYPNEFGGK